jgi:hypothetical protein
VIAVNMRAVAHLQWKWIVITDTIICIVNFNIIPLVAVATSWTDQVGYTIGGVVGALAGVWLSQHWNNE